MKRFFQKHASVIIGIALLVYYAYKTYHREKGRKEVKNNYDLTIGRLIDYSSVGAMESFYMEYSHKVGYRTYERRTSAPYNRFPGCEHDFSRCSDKEFWVAYEKGDPSNSLINVDNEIQNFENPTPPETLEGFR